MTPRQIEKRDLIDRVISLTEESYLLPRSPKGFERREEIEWELIQLFRKISNLSAGQHPYWSEEAWDERQSEPQGQRRRPDRPASIHEVDDLRNLINQLAALTQREPDE